MHPSAFAQDPLYQACARLTCADVHARVHRIDLSKSSAVSAASAAGAITSSLLAGNASIATSASGIGGGIGSGTDAGPFGAFFAALRARIGRVLDSRIAHLEDKVRALDATRTYSAFDFGRFFLLKEGVALAYLQIGAKEEALRCVALKTRFNQKFFGHLT